MNTTYYDEIRDSLKSCKKIDIENDFLRSLFIGDPIETKKHEFRYGPMNGSGYNYGVTRTYLTYLIQRLLGFHRLPMHKERVCYPNQQQFKLFSLQLTNHDIEEHLSCLEECYLHTQRQLAEIFGENAEVKLYRGYSHKYSELVSCAKQRALEVGDSVLRMVTNSFDFFDFHPSYGFSIVDTPEKGRQEGAYLYTAIPVKDILLSYHTINGFHHVDKDTLVVNRDPKGLRVFPLSDVHAPPPDRAFYSKFLELGKRSDEFDYREAFQQVYAHYDATPSYGRWNIVRKQGTLERTLQKLGKYLDRTILNKDDEFAVKRNYDRN